MLEKRDLVIIGGGPGGYVAALRAAQLKKKVTLIEEDRIGGTCMNYGCIPTKFLLHQTQLFSQLKRSQAIEGYPDGSRLNWKRVQGEKKNVVDRLVKGTEFLLKRSGIQVLNGRGELSGDRKVLFSGASGEKTLEAENIILAMGSRSSDLPFLKCDGEKVITHREALDLAEIPRTMTVVGAGAIGLEIGVIFSRAGTEVTILEILPDILPGMDKQIAGRLERMLKKQGLKIFTEMRIEEAILERGGVRLKGTNLKTKSGFEHSAEKVLLAAGRKPNSEMLAKDYANSLDRAGFVQVNSNLKSQLPGIYAIGDLSGGKLLAHKAEHEGIIAAENIAGIFSEMDYQAVPMAVFTEPEFASVGLTEEEAKAQGIQTRIGLFSLQANGRAVTLESPEGMVKLVASTDDRLIGAHILAPQASELIAEMSLALKHGLMLKDIFSTIHVHPTLSEAIMEAALKAKGKAIHALNE